MPDSIGIDGLTVETATEITAALDAGFEGIYGADINVDSNSPDGQMIGILTQIATDLRELLVSVNNNFDPDESIGVLLDQRMAINNIQRKGGTYTIQPISIIVNATVTLSGLDSNFNDPLGTGYTVQDGSGNQFILSSTTTLTAGTTICDFRAQSVGAIEVPIDTITNPVTIIPGVISVNNPNSAITVGVNQESDPAARIRRAASTANATSGNSTGLKGNLLALPGVTEAEVYQNRGGTTDANGTPGHTIWVVVAGGANSDITQLIYKTISDGAEMRGAQSFTIITPSGAPFTAQWDNPTPESLFIRFTIQQTVAGFDFSIPAIKSNLAAALNYGIGQFAETSSITAFAVDAINSQGGGGVPLLMQISLDNATWTDYLVPSSPAAEFTVAAANITITEVSL